MPGALPKLRLACLRLRSALLESIGNRFRHLERSDVFGVNLWDSFQDDGWILFLSRKHPRAITRVVQLRRNQFTWRIAIPVARLGKLHPRIELVPTFDDFKSILELLHDLAGPAGPEQPQIIPEFISNK